jgi:hypothetical protein
MVLGDFLRPKSSTGLPYSFPVIYEVGLTYYKSLVKIRDPQNGTFHHFRAESARAKKLNSNAN